MARNYEIPPNTNEQEKAIGGVLTFIQFFWLLGGALLGILVYITMFSVTKIQFISIPLGILVALSGIPFAFVKKHEMTLFNYITTKRKFNKKNKKLINRRNF